VTGVGAGILAGAGQVPVAAAAALGAGIGSGAWLIISGLTRTVTEPAAESAAAGVAHPELAQQGVPFGFRPLPRGGRDAPAIILARTSAALLAAVLAVVLTRWPVAGLAAGAGAWLAPRMMTGHGSGRARRERMAQLEALATWTESLAATLAAAAGLEQAIVATTRTPPDALAGPLSNLGAAVEAGARLPDALASFSHDVGNPSADAVVAALTLAATRGGSGLREPLTQLAQATREEVTARQQIETGRAQIATDTRLVAGLAAAVIAALVVFNRGFLAPYDGPAGQVVLAVVIAMAARAFVWLRRLAAVQDPPRVIDLGATAEQVRP
jgi:Flp pilus assembly protein TadB